MLFKNSSPCFMSDWELLIGLNTKNGPLDDDKGGEIVLFCKAKSAVSCIICWF